MATSNPKKRPAPGSSPLSIYSQPQMQQSSAKTPSQIPDTKIPAYNQASKNMSYADNAVDLGLNSFDGNVLGQASFGQNGQSTQLARRPLSRQIVQSAPQSSMQMTNGPWEGMLDAQMSGGGVEDNDNIEALEQRAAKVQNEAKSLGGGRKQIPPFVQKLSSFLDESRNTDLIRWSDKGDSFIVLDEDEFAKALIPELFKHNNYASFVRQLNMYGFHKRVRLSDNSMRASERKNKSPSEYYHPYFKRGHPKLLWLINKPPKSGSSKRVTKKGLKVEGAPNDDSDDDMDGVEETFGSGYNSMQATSRALSTAPEGQLPKQELALQNQLMQVQRNQNLMFNAIHRLQTEHNDLLEQAQRFQELHGRHDNSINAILTFLATVFNRGMDGQNPQNRNISQIFNAGIAQDSQNQQNGNVVDMGDVSNQQQDTLGSASPHRRAQRLLMGPPDDGKRVRVKSPSTSASTLLNSAGQQYRSGTVEEVFDSNSPRDSPSPQVAVKHEVPKTLPQQNMMDLINSANANSGKIPSQSKAMEFPAMLAQYEKANGQAPLSNQERSNVLSLMNVSAENGNGTQESPAPSTPDFGSALGYSAAEIDELLKMQNENAEQIEKVANRLDSANIPLSPVPPFSSEGMNNNIDLDQYLDSGAYYDGNSPLGVSVNNAEYMGFDNLGDGTDFDFGLGSDGINDYGNGMSTGIEGGRILETPASSSESSPEDTTAASTLNARQEVEERDRGQRSPSKKRRKG